MDIFGLLRLIAWGIGLVVVFIVLKGFFKRSRAQKEHDDLQADIAVELATLSLKVEKRAPRSKEELAKKVEPINFNRTQSLFSLLVH